MKTSTKFALHYAAIMLLLSCCVSLCTQVAFCAVQPNILLDGNMESGSGSPSNWTFTNYSNGTGTWATDQYTSATHSLKIVMSASGQAFWSQNVTVNPNVNYCVSAQMYATNVASRGMRSRLGIPPNTQMYAPNDPSGACYLFVEWYNGATCLGINMAQCTVANLWTNLMMPNLTPPPGSTNANVQMCAYQAGTYWMDNAVMQPVQNTNLVQNANMETGLGSTPSNWAFTDSSNGTGAWATNEYVSGTHSLEIAMSANGSAFWNQNISGIDPTAQYRVRAYVYATNVTAGSHYLYVEWWNGSTYLGLNKVAATTANAWQEVEMFNLTPPAGANSVGIQLWACDTGRYYVDDVAFQTQDVNTFTFGDGKFPMHLLGAYLGSLPESNLVVNPGLNQFEAYTGQVCYGNGTCPEGWFISSGNTGGTVTWDFNASDAYSHDPLAWLEANQCMKIAQTASGETMFGQWIPVIDPTETYILSGAINASNVTSGSHAIDVDWYNGSTYLSSSSIQSITANVYSLVASTPLTPPANANCCVVMGLAALPGTYHFDCITLNINETLASRYAEAYDAGFNGATAVSADNPATEDNTWDGYGNAGNPSYSFNAMASVGMKSSYTFDHFSTMAEYVPSPPSTALANIVDDIKGYPSMALWYSVDEPAWNGLTAAGVQNGINIIRSNDTGNHPIWQDQAPRGTQADPTNYALCQPYCMTNGVPFVNVESFDIYPVPQGCGDDNLSDQSIACVGEYTGQFYNEVVSYNGTQRVPLWVVLQGFTWGPAAYMQVDFYNSGGGLVGSPYTFEYPSNATGWQEINFTGSVPSGATQAYIQCIAGAPGTYNWDDISFTQSGTNLITDGNFETNNGNNMPAYWGASAGANATLTWSTSTYHSASHSIQTVIASPCGSGTWWAGTFPVSTAPWTFTGWMNTSPTSLGYPVPTQTQMRFMAYDAIINGARGLSVFGLGETANVYTSWPGNTNPGSWGVVNGGLWTTLKEVATEMNGSNGIGRALVSGYLSFRTVSVSNPNIETLLMEYNGYKYLLAANKTESAIGNVTFTIAGLPLSYVTENFDSGVISISNNRFTDSASRGSAGGFAASQVHVYKIE